jgi:hypothetical protein
MWEIGKVIKNVGLEFNIMQMEVLYISFSKLIKIYIRMAKKMNNKNNII